MAPTSKAFVTVLFLSLALCQITVAEPSLKDDSLAEKIVGDLKQLTTLSNNLRGVTEKINVINVILIGPKIPQGFAEITTKVSEATIAISSATNNAHASPLSDDDAKRVVETLISFVQVHQQLLSVVIGKQGLFAFTPLVEPVRVSLVQLEIVVDSFAFALIDLIPTQKLAAKQQFDILAVTIQAAIQAYTNSLSHGDPQWKAYDLS